MDSQKIALNFQSQFSGSKLEILNLKLEIKNTFLTLIKNNSIFTCLFQ